jgi:hypothetical protein
LYQCILKVIERLLWNTAQHEYSTYGDVNLKDRVKALATLGRTPYGGRARVSAKAPTLAERVTLVIGSSEQVHVVDALAITGDEGRGSLRKASGSWQTSFDPKMSEWGNPLRMEYP